MDIYWRCFLIVSLAAVWGESTDINKIRARMLSKIIMSYNAFLPPTVEDQPVRVSVSFSLKRFGQVDENDLTAKFQLFLHQNWTDVNMRWERSEYNISSTFIPRRLLWIPEIVARNGGSIEETLSRDVRVNEDGQVTDARVMEVTLPCRHTEPQFLEGKSGDDSSAVAARGNEKRIVCSLAIGSWVETTNDLVFEPGIADVNTMQTNTSTSWRVEDIHTHGSTEPVSYVFDEMFSIAVFDFILLRDIAKDYSAPLQIIVPSIMTSLTANFVFSLPPLARERITIVGVGFLSHIVLSGVTVLAQSQSSDSADLSSFMIFSIVYMFFLIVAVLVSFLVYPFLKKTAPREEMDPCEDNLIQIHEKGKSYSILDVTLFFAFTIFYCIGAGTIFS